MLIESKSSTSYKSINLFLFRPILSKLFTNFSFKKEVASILLFLWPKGYSISSLNSSPELSLTITLFGMALLFRS